MAAHSPQCPKLPWMINFHSTADGTIPNAQLKAVYAKNHLEYVTNLDIDSQIPKRFLTTIMCTIGPRSNNVETLEKMMKAGMKVARINMSFYSTSECEALIKTIDQARVNYSKKIGRIYPLAIAVDIKGPEIRTGSLKISNREKNRETLNKDKSNENNKDISKEINKETNKTEIVDKKIQLQEGNTVNITSDPAYSEHVTEDMIYVDYQTIQDVVEPGDNIYLDNGKIHLSAMEIVGSIIRCLVENAGKISDKALVSLPGVPIDLPYLSEKDILDLKFCSSENVDVIIAPVSCASNIQFVRETLGTEGQSIFLFSKITSAEGVRNIDEIIRESDGIVLGRSKIALDLPKEKMFMIQKSIIGKCNQAGKPFVCAPKMLESMVDHQRPTDAELADVANVILDGADGVLLSRETSMGKYPVQTIETLVEICKEAEAAVYQREVLNSLMSDFVSPIEIIHGLAQSSVDISMKTNAAVIVVTTTTGRTAKLISKFRPRCPIVAVTRLGAVARRLQVFRGVEALQYIKPLKQDWNKELMRRVQFGITYAKMSGFVRAGDAIVMVISPKPGTGFTNSIKVVYASEFDALPERSLA